MNRRKILRTVCLACSLLWIPAGAIGQSTAAALEKKPQKTVDTDDARVIELPMDTPVLTIKGFCPGNPGATDSKACETIVTRAQFERLVGAVQPGMNRTVKQQLAAVYPKLLVLSHAAEEAGLDKTPEFEQQIAMVRLQILSQAYTAKLQKDAMIVSDDDISDYYQKNPDMFEQYTLQKLIVPLRKQSVAAESSEDEMAQLAGFLRARAASGQDFLKLQKEAFATAGIKIESPNTSMGKVLGTALPKAHLGVLDDLKAGEVSQVVSDTGGHYVYKLESKEKLRLAQVKDEIHETIQRERLKDAMDKIQNSFTAEKNEAYFGAARAPKREKPDDDTR